MTKKEIQKRLLDSLGLMVGDRIKVTQKNYVHTNKIFVIREEKDEYDEYYLELESETPSRKREMYLLSILIDKDWERIDQ